MCWPDYFDVSYNINTWMEGQQGKVDRSLAVQQWTNLRNALSEVANIELVMSDEGTPDLVFTANAGIIQGNKAVVSTFRSKERQPEEAIFTEWFEKNGFDVYHTSHYYEGEGDHLRDQKGRHWMGSGFRTDEFAAEELAIILDTDINVLKLVDPRWYHLDTAFCPLPMGGIMWYPGAFSPASQHKIRTTFAINLEVSLEDALLFCCNCICIGENLFMPSGSKAAERLRGFGYKVWEGDLSEFLKAGGAAKCLVLDCNFETYDK